MKHTKLKLRIKELHKTQLIIAKELGITLQCFNGKINGRYQFTLKEMIIMIKILEIADPIDIFFAKNVPYMRHK